MSRSAVAAQSPFKAILLLLVLTVIAVAAIWTLVTFVGLQASLIWTGALGILAWAIQNSIQQRQEFRRLLADQKRQQYFEFLDFLNSFIAVGGEENAQYSIGDDPERLRQFRRWSLRLTMIGSDDVVRTWNKARTGLPSGQGEGDSEKLAHTVNVLRHWGALWLAMRKDCGHFDTKLTITDVLASFINDIEKYRLEIEAHSIPHRDQNA